MDRTKRSFYLICVLLVSGCAAHQQKELMSGYERQYRSGDYEQAAVSMEQELEPDEELGFDREGLLWALHAAESYRMAGEPKKAIALYDQSEKIYKHHNDRILSGKFASALKSVAVNDAQRDYMGYAFEGILANTYKALSFLEQRDYANARVELNRADDRARRAEDRYEKLVEGTREAVTKDEQNGTVVQKALKDDSLRAKISKQFPNIRRWEGYEDFVNPFSEWLHGLYFLTLGNDAADVEKSRGALKRVAGMVDSDSQYVLQDLELAEKMASGKVARANSEPLVWVVYENGRGPIFKERRFDVPIPIEGQVLLGSIALPKLRERGPASRGLVIDTGTSRARTQTLARMDRIVKSEFKELWPGILARSIASAVVKLVTQHVARKEGGVVGGLGALIYSAATTAADTRIWRSLPDRWEIARIEKPRTGVIKVRTPEGRFNRRITLPDARYSLVYVKLPAIGARPYISATPLQRDGGKTLHVTASR